jgi:hypothetical protein
MCAETVNNEIEVTPEMLKAGALELAGYDSEFENIEEAVARLYRAMVRAKSSQT